MHDELTKEDLRKMQEELDYRRLELMPGADRGGQAHPRLRGSEREF